MKKKKPGISVDFWLYVWSVTISKMRAGIRRWYCCKNKVVVTWDRNLFTFLSYSFLYLIYPALLYLYVYIHTYNELVVCYIFLNWHRTINIPIAPGFEAPLLIVIYISTLQNKFNLMCFCQWKKTVLKMWMVMVRTRQLARNRAAVWGCTRVPWVTP